MEKYNFNSLNIGTRAIGERKKNYIEYNDGIIEEKFIENFQKCINDGSFYSLGANFDDDTRYITIECSDNHFSFGYYNSDNEEDLGLVNLDYLGDRSEVIIGSGYSEKCFANTDMKFLFDAVIYFLKTGDKLETGVWKGSDWDGMTI